MTLEQIENADLIVIRGRNYRDRKTAALEIFRIISKVYHLLLCSQLSKRMVLIGASVWDQKSNLASRLLGFAFRSCEFVTVREPGSFEVAKRIANSYNLKEPVLIPDLSFAAFADRKDFIANRVGISSGQHPEMIGLTLHDWKPESREIRNKYLDSITGFVNFFSNLGSQIIIIPQVSVTWEDNSKLVKELMVNVGTGKIDVIKGNPSVRELLQLYSSLDILMATRMHSAIFAAAVNTPFVAIAYDKGGKWNIIEELGYRDYLINYDDVTPEILINKAVLCWKNRSNLVTGAQEVVEQNINNVQVLEKIIKNCVK